MGLPDFTTALSEGLECEVVVPFLSLADAGRRFIDRACALDRYLQAGQLNPKVSDLTGKDKQLVFIRS
tara:strand:+ start:191 stop:394 length:204 start_codon:yes stop_codon:yes gene_type:complete